MSYGLEYYFELVSVGKRDKEREEGVVVGIIFFCRTFTPGQFGPHFSVFWKTQQHAPHLAPNAGQWQGQSLPSPLLQSPPVLKGACWPCVWQWGLKEEKIIREMNVWIHEYIFY